MTWGGFAITVIFVFIRIPASLRAFKTLYVDDAFVFFALTLSLASAILWQIFANNMYQMMAVASGREIPGPTFATDSKSYSKASAAVIVLFYSTLWAIKISFLIFLSGSQERQTTRGCVVAYIRIRSCNLFCLYWYNSVPLPCGST